MESRSLSDNSARQHVLHLEEQLSAKEKDVELAATIGQDLLGQVSVLRARVAQLEAAAKAMPQAKAAMPHPAASPFPRTPTKQAPRSRLPTLLSQHAKAPSPPPPPPPPDHSATTPSLNPLSQGTLATPSQATPNPSTPSLNPHLAKQLDASLVAQLRSLQLKFADADEKRESLDRECTLLRAQTDALSNTERKLNERIWDKEIQTQQLQESNDALQKDVIRHQAKIKVCERDLSQSKDLIESLRANEANWLKEKQTIVFKMESESNRKRREIAILKREKLDLEKQIDQLASNSAMHSFQFNRSGISACSSRSDLSLSAKLPDPPVLKDRINSNTSYHGSIHNMSTNSDLFVSSISKALSQAHTQNEDLRTQNTTLRHNTRELERLLQEANEAIESLKLGCDLSSLDRDGPMFDPSFVELCDQLQPSESMDSFLKFDQRVEEVLQVSGTNLLAELTQAEINVAPAAEEIAQEASLDIFADVPDAGIHFACDEDEALQASTSNLLAELTLPEMDPTPVNSTRELLGAELAADPITPRVAIAKKDFSCQTDAIEPHFFSPIDAPMLLDELSAMDPAVPVPSSSQTTTTQNSSFEGDVSFSSSLGSSIHKNAGFSIADLDFDSSKQPDQTPTPAPPPPSPPSHPTDLSQPTPSQLPFPKHSNHLRTPTPTNTTTTGTPQAWPRHSRQDQQQTPTTQHPHGFTPSQSLPTRRQLNFVSGAHLARASAGGGGGGGPDASFSTPEGMRTRHFTDVSFEQQTQEYVQYDGTAIESLTATMIGTWFLKLNRHGKKPQLRFFWINPYSRMLHWTPTPATTSTSNANKTKTAFIKQLKYADQEDPNNAPHQTKNYPPNHRHALEIVSRERSIVMIPLTWQDHRAWTDGLTLLLSTFSSGTATTASEAMADATPLHERFKILDPETSSTPTQIRYTPRRSMTHAGTLLDDSLVSESILSPHPRRCMTPTTTRMVPSMEVLERVEREERAATPVGERKRGLSRLSFNHLRMGSSRSGSVVEK
ncbi:hypothetical protein HDU98_008355 [Podochytrium sp. JEL0797]|nr:hypothetical protein HDU98_008355 [Podochytrium sp. JEL0797]